MWLLPALLLLTAIVLSIPLSAYFAWLMDGKYRAPRVLKWFEDLIDTGRARHGARCEVRRRRPRRSEGDLGLVTDHALRRSARLSPARGGLEDVRYCAAVSTLVLLRHGESVWNEQNLFTGWQDVGLSDKGKREARRLRSPAGERGDRPTDRAHLGARARDPHRRARALRSRTQLVARPAELATQRTPLRGPDRAQQAAGRRRTRQGPAPRVAPELRRATAASAAKAMRAAPTPTLATATCPASCCLRPSAFATS